LHGRLEVVDLLLLLGKDRQVDVHADDELAFRLACQFGHHDVVDRLLKLRGDRKIDVHVQDEVALRQACSCYSENGTRMVQLLLNLTGSRTVNTRVLDDEAFKNACRVKNWDKAKLLLTSGRSRMPSHESYALYCEENMPGSKPYEEWLNHASNARKGDIGKLGAWTKAGKGRADPRDSSDGTDADESDDDPED